MATTTRPTGRWTDRVRVAWRRVLGPRFPALDRLAHRAYFQWQRFALAPRVAADARSLLAYLRLEGPAIPPAPVPVRVRPLGGRVVWLRPRTTDALMLRETFRDLVHPPPDLGRPVRNLLDLGANAGVTVAHNALLHPNARIVAVELDPGNAEAARRNLAWLGERVVVLQGAVWTSDGEVAYDDTTGEHGFRVVPEGADGARTRALSMASILSHVPADERVDYVKMDVEGVESLLLSGPESAWLDRVDSIGLQVHGTYTTADCIRDLESHGFEARVDGRRMNYVVGVRRRNDAGPVPRAHVVRSARAT